MTMSTKIILTTDETLTMEEVSDLSFLFADALGEFAARRSDARDYVEGRYPDLVEGEFDDKVIQVARRVQVARKLHNAALTYKTILDQPGLDSEMLEEMVLAGERAKACKLLLRDVFGMEDSEAEAAFNQLEDKRVARLMRETGLVSL